MKLKKLSHGSVLLKTENLQRCKSSLEYYFIPFSKASVVDFQQLSTNLSNYWPAVKIVIRQPIRPLTPIH